MIIPFRNFGKFGMIWDAPPHSLPVGAWNYARNVRFRSGYLEKVPEPVQLYTDAKYSIIDEDIVWIQQFYLNDKGAVAIAGRTKIWTIVENQVMNLSGSGYDAGGTYWQAFPWGDTVVFNNGIDPPQVLNPVTKLFVDLPNWGIISNDAGTATFDANVKARVLLPYKSFLVAIGFDEDDELASTTEDPNGVWWSDSVVSPKLWQTGPTWDYKVSTNNSGKNKIGLEDGPLTWGASLGEGFMIYTEKSAYSMLFVGGNFIMDFRRILEYGCVGLHCSTTFNNLQFVVGPDVMYVHDGNTVKQIAEERMQKWFNQLSMNINDTCHTVTDYTNREVVIYFDGFYKINEGYKQPTNTSFEPRIALVYNYDDDSFHTLDASFEEALATTPEDLKPVVCMSFGAETVDVGTAPDQSKRNLRMFWATANRVYEAYADSDTAPQKAYIAYRDRMDLDDLIQEWTTNTTKYISEAFIHAIDRSDSFGTSSFDITLGWSATIAEDPVMEYDKTQTFEMDGTLSGGQYKVDFRTAGRYLAMEFDFECSTFAHLSGMDVNASLMHGR